MIGAFDGDVTEATFTRECFQLTLKHSFQFSFKDVGAKASLISGNRQNLSAPLDLFNNFIFNHIEHFVEIDVIIPGYSSILSHVLVFPVFMFLN